MFVFYDCLSCQIQYLKYHREHDAVFKSYQMLLLFLKFIKEGTALKFIKEDTALRFIKKDAALKFIKKGWRLLRLIKNRRGFFGRFGTRN